MLASPFAFYRGAAAIMAADLVGTPASGIKVQCCGDAHLANFGGFESPERRMVFDINDFDETLPGPWEWDVKRLAASMTIAVPSGIQMFCWIASLWRGRPRFDTPLRTAAERRDNLKPYVARMAARYYPDLTQLAGVAAAA